MNHDSSINIIPTAQDKTAAINNTDVASRTKENTKNKSNIESESNTICRESNENENLKSKRKSAVILGDSMIKQTNWWETAKKLKPECKVFVRIFPAATTQYMADYMKP